MNRLITRCSDSVTFPSAQITAAQVWITGRAVLMGPSYHRTRDLRSRAERRFASSALLASRARMRHRDRLRVSARDLHRHHVPDLHRGLRVGAGSWNYLLLRALVKVSLPAKRGERDHRA